MRALLAALCLCGAQAAADTVVAARTIRSHQVLALEDLRLVEGTAPGSFTAREDLVGLEARVVLYPGRPIRSGDVGPAAIIERNQIVTLLYRRGTLTIAADARALGRAGIGDRLRVMNLASRSTVTGVVLNDGTVRVGGPDLAGY